MKATVAIPERIQSAIDALLATNEWFLYDVKGQHLFPVYSENGGVSTRLSVMLVPANPRQNPDTIKFEFVAIPNLVEG